MAMNRRSDRDGWPRGLYEPRPGYYVFREKLSKITRPIGRVTLDEAKAWVAENGLVDVIARVERSRVTSSSEWRAMKTQTFHRAKTRSRIAGREMMTREEFERLWRRAGGFCELTGIPLSPRPKDFRGVFPWVASLDRIDSQQGYLYSNCRILCCAMNVALNEFGEAVFRRLSESFAIHQVNKS